MHQLTKTTNRLVKNGQTASSDKASSPGQSGSNSKQVSTDDHSKPAGHQSGSAAKNDTSQPKRTSSDSTAEQAHQKHTTRHAGDRNRSNANPKRDAKSTTRQHARTGDHQSQHHARPADTDTNKAPHHDQQKKAHRTPDNVSTLLTRTVDDLTHLRLDSKTHQSAPPNGTEPTTESSTRAHQSTAQTTDPNRHPVDRANGDSVQSRTLRSDANRTESSGRRGGAAHYQLGNLLNDDVIRPLTDTVRSVGQNKPVTKIINGTDGTVGDVLDSTTGVLPDPLRTTVRNVTNPVHETAHHTLDHVATTVDRTVPHVTTPASDTLEPVGESVGRTLPVTVPKPVGGLVDHVTDTVGKTAEQVGRTVPGKPIRRPILGPSHSPSGDKPAEGGTPESDDSSAGKVRASSSLHDTRQPAPRSDTRRQADSDSPAGFQQRSTKDVAPVSSAGQPRSHDHSRPNLEYNTTPAETTAQHVADQASHGSSTESMPSGLSESSRTSPTAGTTGTPDIVSPAQSVSAFVPRTVRNRAAATSDASVPTRDSAKHQHPAEAVGGTTTPHRTSTTPDGPAAGVGATGSVSSPTFAGPQHPATTDSQHLIAAGTAIGPVAGPNQHLIQAVQNPGFSPD